MGVLNHLQLTTLPFDLFDQVRWIVLFFDHLCNQVDVSLCLVSCFLFREGVNDSPSDRPKF